jgi:hypothetical protein
MSGLARFCCFARRLSSEALTEPRLTLTGAEGSSVLALVRVLSSIRSPKANLISFPHLASRQWSGKLARGD